MTNLTEEQAYIAMMYFLNELYNRTKSDDLGALLGGMSLLPDGSTADAAATHDWQEAVSYALNGGKAVSLQLR